MARPTANLRLFVAVYPPPDTARLLLEAMRRLRPAPHRETPVDQIHLTLQFIGDMPTSRLDETIESVQRAKKGLAAFALQFEKLITLPDHGPPPRLIAARTDAPPALMELQRRLALRFAVKARATPGDRFTPHMTLCRFNPPRSGDPKPVRIDEPIEGIESFTVSEFMLMKSILQPDGARHVLVAHCLLQPADR